MTFASFLAVRERASDAYITGDVEPLLTLSTKHDPASFFPPGGERIVGAQRVNEANKKGAALFAKGSTGHFEVLASGSDGHLGYWTGVQHSESMMKGKDKPIPMRLRVTEIFRNEDGAWKLVHRHADMVPDDK